MKRGIYSVFLILGLVAAPQFAWGAVPDVYTNENYHTSTHEAPADFSSDGFGGFFGRTTSGRVFTQIKITNSLNIDLYKFSIDEAFFYMTDRGQIWAQSDIAAVSIYLALG